MVKVIILDEFFIIKEGLKSILYNNKDIQLVGDFSTYESLIKWLSKNTTDIVILEINYSKKTGVEYARMLQMVYPDIKIMFMTQEDDEDIIFKAIKTGAKGIITKKSDKEELIEAILTIEQGNEFFSENISNIILKSYIKKIKSGNEISEKRPRNLTRREIQILKLVCDGLTNKEIADGLFISIRTVDSHKNHIMQKLNLKTSADLIKFAIKNGIVQL